MTLRDEQNEVVKELSSLVDIETIDHANGTVQVSFGRGKPLVIGDVAYAVTVQNEPTTGFARLYSGVTDVTTAISGGKVAGADRGPRRQHPGYRPGSTRWPTRWCSRSTRCTTPASSSAGTDAPPSSSRWRPPTGAAAHRGRSDGRRQRRLIAAGGVREAGRQRRRPSDLAACATRACSRATARRSSILDRPAFRRRPGSPRRGVRRGASREIVEQIETCATPCRACRSTRKRRR